MHGCMVAKSIVNYGCINFCGFGVCVGGGGGHQNLIIILKGSTKKADGKALLKLC